MLTFIGTYNMKLLIQSFLRLPQVKRKSRNLRVKSGALCFAPYISSLDFYPPLSCSTLAVLKVVSY